MDDNIISNININTNNDYMKLYCRFLKENKLYNKKHLSLKRYIEVMKYSSAYKEDSVLYNLDLPNVFIDCKVPLIKYKILHRDYMLLILKPITKLICNLILQKYTIIYNNVKKTMNIKEIIKHVYDDVRYKIESINEKSSIESLSHNVLKTIVINLNHFISNFDTNITKNNSTNIIDYCDVRKMLENKIVWKIS